MDKIIKSKSKKGYEKVKPINQIKKDTPVKKTNKNDKSTSDSFRTPSDIEDALNELQGNSDQSEEDDEIIGKDFIPNAIGLRGKAYVAPHDDGEDEEEEMLIEEREEDDDEEDEEGDE